MRVVVSKPMPVQSATFAALEVSRYTSNNPRNRALWSSSGTVQRVHG